MKEFDVTVEFCECEKFRDIYTIEAETEEEAAEEAMQMAIEDISIIDVEDVSKAYSTKPRTKFNRYLLNQIDKTGDEWTLIESKDVSYLIGIAEKISIPDIKRVEVIGTNDKEKEYKSWSVLFARRF